MDNPEKFQEFDAEQSEAIRAIVREELAAIMAESQKAGRKELVAGKPWRPGPC